MNLIVAISRTTKSEGNSVNKLEANIEKNQSEVLAKPDGSSPSHTNPFLT